MKVRLVTTSVHLYSIPYYINLSNIYLENNQKIQYIKHSKYRQDSETGIILLFNMSNICFQQIDDPFILISHEDHPFL